MINILQNINKVDKALIKRVYGRYYRLLDDKDKYNFFLEEKLCVDCGQLIAGTRTHVNGKTNRCGACLKIQKKIWAREHNLKNKIKRLLKDYTKNPKFNEHFYNEVFEMQKVNLKTITDQENLTYLKRLSEIRKLMKNLY